MSSVRNTKSGEDCRYAGLNILLVKSKTYFESFNFCSLCWKLRNNGCKAIAVTVTLCFLPILLNVPLGAVTLRHYTRGLVAHARTEHKAVKHKPVMFEYGTVNSDTAFDTFCLLCKAIQCAEKQEVSGFAQKNWDQLCEIAEREYPTH